MVNNLQIIYSMQRKKKSPEENFQYQRKYYPCVERDPPPGINNYWDCSNKPLTKDECFDWWENRPLNTGYKLISRSGYLWYMLTPFIPFATPHYFSN